jgi:hypothetical protein
MRSATTSRLNLFMALDWNLPVLTEKIREKTVRAYSGK